MKVRVIPAIPKFNILEDEKPRKKKVAGYARVSTDSDEQHTSYEAQVDYYTNYIKNNKAWEFVKVFTDEGISATSTKNREGFKEMIRRALDGEIDLIITKSVSRFARNTVDTLTTVRLLKEKGVEVFFEKENIYTLDSKGELLITIMSSLAQEESRSISENVTWGQRKRFADGKISLPYKHFLGYEKGENGLPKIVESEAKTIRLIYDMFYYQGKTPSSIATILTREGITTPSGKVRWVSSTIESILTNEKYKGDALLQKSFTVDFLTKKKKINEGEVQQYYIEGSHPAIISPELFDLVQIEIEKRKGQKRSSAGVFSSKLVCGDCGNFYGSKVWHSDSKYRQVIWQCNQKYKNAHRCSTPHLTEQSIKKAFVKAFNSKIENREEILQVLEYALLTLTDTSKIETKIISLEADLRYAAERVQAWVKENTHCQLQATEYEAEYIKRTNAYTKLSEDIENLEKEKAIRLSKKKELESALYILKNADTLIEEFDEALFFATVETITVNHDRSIVFNFKDGTSVEEKTA